MIAFGGGNFYFTKIGKRNTGSVKGYCKPLPAAYRLPEHISVDEYGESGVEEQDQPFNTR